MQIALETLGRYLVTQTQDQRLNPEDTTWVGSG